MRKPTAALASLLCAHLATTLPLRPAAAQSAQGPAEGQTARSVAVILAAQDRAAEARALGARLRGMHAAVVIPLPSQVASMPCDTAGEQIAALARTASAQLDLPPIRPVLVGLGAAGPLAYAAAAELPGAFKGLTTLDFKPDPDHCPSPPPRGKAPLRWHDVGAAPAAPSLSGVRHYPSQTPQQDPEARGPDAPVPQPLIEAYLALAGMDHAFAPDLADAGALEAAGLADMPITLHVDPAATARGIYAVFLSGDGGWARFDQQIAERLAAMGIPVLGVSSLRYLWQEKSPERIAADVARLDAFFAPRLNGARLLLAGFSLGANVTPFYAPHLAPSLRERLAGIVLLSPERRTGFEIVIGGWLGRATGARDVPAAIDAAAAGGLRLLCLYGEDDDFAACPEAKGARRIAFDGEHHMDGAYDLIASAIVGFLAEKTPPAAADSR